MYLSLNLNIMSCRRKAFVSYLSTVTEKDYHIKDTDCALMLIDHSAHLLVSLMV